MGNAIEDGAEVANRRGAEGGIQQLALLLVLSSYGNYKIKWMFPAKDAEIQHGPSKERRLTPNNNRLALHSVSLMWTANGSNVHKRQWRRLTRT